MSNEDAIIDLLNQINQSREIETESQDQKEIFDRILIRSGEANKLPANLQKVAEYPELHKRTGHRNGIMTCNCPMSRIYRETREHLK